MSIAIRHLLRFIEPLTALLQKGLVAYILNALQVGVTRKRVDAVKRLL